MDCNLYPKLWSLEGLVMQLGQIRIEGTGAVRTAGGISDDLASFEISKARGTPGEPGEGAVHLKIVDRHGVMIDDCVRGVDEFQALELAIGFVRRVLVVTQAP
jgi:hypothetical protein